MAKNGILSVQKGQNINKMKKLQCFMFLKILFILNRINLQLMPWLIQLKKNMEGKAIYVQLAQSVQKSQINNTVTSKQAYRQKKNVLSFGQQWV